MSPSFSRSAGSTAFTPLASGWTSTRQHFEPPATAGQGPQPEHDRRHWQPGQNSEEPPRDTLPQLNVRHLDFFRFLKLALFDAGRGEYADN